MDRTLSRRPIFNRIIKKRNILLLATIVIFGVLLFIQNDFKQISSITPIRQLDKNSNMQTPNKILDYYFIHNISQYPYFGKWSNFEFEKPNFILDQGEALVYFSFAQTQSFSSNKTSSLASMERNQTLDLEFVLKDGHYLDNFFRGNTSLQFPVGFYDNITEAIKANTVLKLINKNVTLTIVYGEYINNSPNETYTSTDIEITFIPNNRVLNTNIEVSSSNLYSNVTITITNTVKQFKVTIEAMMENTNGYSVKTLNYSIILTLIGFIEIYYSTHLLIEVGNNIQSGLNLDVITIVFQIMWNSVICSVHFFLALSFEDLSYEYGTSSIVFFILFSIFQMKTLFLSWKSRYNDLFHENIIQFRKKLLQFYTSFYISLFLFLISLKYWYNNFILVYIIFSSTWIFQIIHSARTGTKPPFTFNCIIFLSLSKLFIPVSVNYSYTILIDFFIIDLYQSLFWQYILIETCLWKSLLYIIDHFCRGINYHNALILSLQKILGPKFIIPRFLREKSFEYYQNIDCITNLQNECVICLEKLKTNSININIGPSWPLNSSNKISDKTYGEYIINFISKFKDKINKKEYMVTPCRHIFHTACLETWMEMKNECPYCRNKIPPLDY